MKSPTTLFSCRALPICAEGIFPFNIEKTSQLVASTQLNKVVLKLNDFFFRMSVTNVNVDWTCKTLN